MIEVKPEGTSTLLELSGKIGVEVAAQLQQTLQSALSTGSVVHVDATKVEQLHTASAQVLIAAIQTCPTSLLMDWDADSPLCGELKTAGIFNLLNPVRLASSGATHV